MYYNTKRSLDILSAIQHCYSANKTLLDWEVTVCGDIYSECTVQSGGDGV